VRLYNQQKTNGLMANIIQIIIAIILFLTFLVLILNLRSLQEQIGLTQVLNQPLCAVKEIKINEVNAPNRFKIYAVITNSGNYNAKNATIEWEFYQCDDLISRQTCNKIKGWHSDPKKKMNVTILPKQEFNYFLIDVPQAGLNERVKGYDRGVGIEITIKYKDMNNSPQKYSGFYLITRIGALNIYEATIQKSDIENQYSEPDGLKNEPQSLSPIIPHDASPSVIVVPQKDTNK